MRDRSVPQPPCQGRTGQGGSAPSQEYASNSVGPRGNLIIQKLKPTALFEPNSCRPMVPGLPPEAHGEQDTCLSPSLVTSHLPTRR